MVSDQQMAHSSTSVYKPFSRRHTIPGRVSIGGFQFLTDISSHLAHRCGFTSLRSSLQWHFSPREFSPEFSPKRHDGEQGADDPLFPRGLFPGMFPGTANTSCPSRADVTR